MTKTSISEKIYPRLLRLYPESFRAEFGAAMELHFRDQLREALESSKAFPLVRFWCRIAVDTLVAAGKARMSNSAKAETSTRPGSQRRIPSFGLLFLAFLAPLIWGLIAHVGRNLPKTYMSIARMDVQKARNGGANAYDPYFLQTQHELLKSTPVLEQVVNELDLANRFP